MGSQLKAHSSRLIAHGSLLHYIKMYGANISSGFVWQFPPFAVSLGTKSV